MFRRRVWLVVVCNKWQQLFLHRVTEPSIREAGCSLVKEKEAQVQNQMDGLVSTSVVVDFGV